MRSKGGRGGGVPRYYCISRRFIKKNIRVPHQHGPGAGDVFRDCARGGGAGGAFWSTLLGCKPTHGFWSTLLRRPPPPHQVFAFTPCSSTVRHRIVTPVTWTNLNSSYDHLSHVDYHTKLSLEIPQQCVMSWLVVITCVQQNKKTHFRRAYDTGRGLIHRVT